MDVTGPIPVHYGALDVFTPEQEEQDTEDEVAFEDVVYADEEVPQ